MSIDEQLTRSAGIQSPHGGGRKSEVGPLLYLRGLRDDRLLLTALVIRSVEEKPSILFTDLGDVSPTTVLERSGHRVMQYTFSLPADPNARYALDGERFEVNAAFEGDLRIAYVSCNGQEHGDLDRSLEERNPLWRRLCDEHAERPFQLLLHGGDQIYADEVIEAHPRLGKWAANDPAARAEEAPPAGEVARALQRAYFERYLDVLGQPGIAWLMARVPSLAMWDDHDICDGWGSLRRSRLDAPIGRRLFQIAREHFLLFQLGAAPDQIPEASLDASGQSLGFHVELPGLHVIAPDLRSERRPDRVMGEQGWKSLETALERAREGRVLLMSSVPALGPRLSWLESVMKITPWMEKYEDDLRDQWQSRAHRAEWRRFLRSVADVHARAGCAATFLSGEIHLATRATLDVPPMPIHQLVASGIAHPAPPAVYARALGILARFGDTPLSGHPIRMWPLPGQASIYTAQRNYLVIERRDGAWRAWWELENDGPTEMLDL